MVAGSPEHWQRSDTAPYEAAVRYVGGEPVVIAADTQPSTIGELLDAAGGVLLMGGDDVNPRLYGEEAGPHTEPPDSHRDTIELALLHEAMHRDLPMLAICRGMQLLNVRLGGSLVQHLPSVERHVRRTPDRGAPAHTVRIESGSLLARIAGESLSWDVNSRHHQGIAQLGARLRVSARDPEDGVIEAIERPDRRFCLGVQWHPENQCATDSRHADLFRAFVAAF
jgi:gamma-glutamyl-gamma-aminobutyrate hydrolase PuuD